MKQLIAGNWKMNLNAAQTVDLIEHLKAEDAADVVICPPFPYLSLARHLLVGSPIQLGAQDCQAAASGAYTGDVSAAMLVDMGCTYVILGHSERRQGHKETSELVLAKAVAAVGQGLNVIICIGETDEENKAGATEKVLLGQLKESIPQGLSARNLVIAYEPVWAIGTGRTASNEEIVAAHAFIRAQLKGLCEDPEHVKILYGGSVNAKNAAEILGLANMGGVLVGGASLKADDFNTIIRAGACE